MCKSSNCHHKKESPIKDWKHRCQYGPDGKRLHSGTVIVGWNDLATTHPELAKECLDDATKYVAGTAKKLCWKCSICPNKWKATGCNRVNGCGGCGVCANRIVLKGWNDIATTRPDLAEECLDDATKYTASTNKKLRWKCRACQRKWKATGWDRFNGCGCPHCAKRGHDQTKESFFYLVHRSGQFKIGIMNTETIRLDKHSRSGWSVVEKIMMEGGLVRDLETKVKQLLRKNGVPTGAKAFRKKFDGYTEAWQAVDLEVTSIDDLLEKLGTSFDALLAC